MQIWLWFPTPLAMRVPFVVYLEKGKVLQGPKFLKCVCIHVGL